MLDPTERLVFDGMVSELRTEDPAFRREIDRLCRPRSRVRTGAAVLLWTISPFSILFGGWSGVLLAALAVGYGTHLWTRRTGTGPQPQWWTATRGRSPDQLA